MSLTGLGLLWWVGHHTSGYPQGLSIGVQLWFLLGIATKQTKLHASLN